MQDGEEYGSAILRESNNWTYTFPNLDIMRDGVEIVYTVTEDKVDGYTLTREEPGKYSFTMTNHHTPEETEVHVIKDWSDGDDQDGIRPDKITVNLLQNRKVYRTQELSEKNGWEYTFTGLPVFTEKEEGVKAEYTVEEDGVPSGYRVAVDGTAAEGYKVSNTHVPEETEIKVTKKWSNAGDPNPPKSVTVQLWANNRKLGDPVELSADNSWTWTWQGLPVFEDGKRVNYEAKETAVTDYRSVVTKVTDGFEIENIYEPGKTEVSVKKVWSDGDNRDGIRPADVTVHLLANGTEVPKVSPVKLSEENKWSWKWTGLDAATPEGGSITYTVTEDEVAGYGKPAITGTQSEGFVIENPYTPEETEISVTKKWNDGNNRDGIRPKSVKVYLLSDGTRADEQTLSEENKWTYKWTGLPKCKDGKDINYSVEEEKPSDYKPTLTGSAAEGFTITNTHEPVTVKVTVEKAWKDRDDLDKLRPQSITVRLLADEKVADTAILSEANEWKTEWTGLPKYRDGKEGETIVYKLEEVQVDGYTCAITGTVSGGFKITNTHEPVGSLIIRKNVTVNGSPAEGNAAAKGKFSFTVTGPLGYNETVEIPVENGKSKEVKLTNLVPGEYTIHENETQGWRLTGENDLKVTVEADNETSIPTKEFTNDTSLLGSLWITKTVRINGVAAAAGNSSADGTFTYTITGPNSFSETRVIKFTNGRPTPELPLRLENLVPGKYTVTESSMSSGWSIVSPTSRKVEIEVKGNEAPVNGTPPAYALASFINNRNTSGGSDPDPTPERPVTTPKPTTSVPATKVWEDNNDEHKVRPAEVTLQLLANGVPVDVATVSGDGNVWTYTFKNLPKLDENDVPIEYTVVELGTYEYYTSSSSGTTVTNTLDERPPEEYTNISGIKTWFDSNNEDGTRPNYITVYLLRDGEVYQKRVVTAQNNWRFSFNNLPADDGYGHRYTYTIREEAEDGYFMRQNGYDLSNTKLPAPPPPPPPLEDETEEELEELVDLFDYDTPLFGMMKTGEETPMWPFISAAVGLLAILTLILMGRKKKRYTKPMDR